MQAAAQVTELEVPLKSRVAWLRRNYSYFEDEHKDLLMAKLGALTKTSGKKVCSKEHLAQYICNILRGLSIWKRMHDLLFGQGATHCSFRYVTTVTMQ